MCLFIHELPIMIMESGCRQNNNSHMSFIIAVKLFTVYEATLI